MKRGQQWGRGYLYQRGRIWWIQYHINGRPHRQSTGTGDRTLARRLLDIRLGEAAKGSLVRPSSRQLRIPDLLELVWRDYRVNEHKSLE